MIIAYVAESTNTESENYNHNLEDVYFITPILCKHCKLYNILEYYITVDRIIWSL